VKPGREYNKSITASAGTGLTESGASTKIDVAPIKSQQPVVRNPAYRGEIESGHTLMGVGDGVSEANQGTLSEKWGYTTHTGTSIEVTDQSVAITHHSGAAVKIDPDGAIYITSSSRKGIGISAPYGDAFLAASGEIAINGASLSCSVSGDYNLSVGGTYNIRCAGYKLNTNVVDETIDGSASRTVTNDSAIIIGGINRLVVAGDQRVQVSGSDIIDVAGNKTDRVKGNSLINSKGTYTVAATGNLKVSSKGTSDFISDGNLSISSKSAIKQVSAGATKISAAGTLDVKGSGATKISSDAAISVEGSGTARLVGSTATVGGSTVNLATATLNAPTPTGSGGSTSPSVTATDSPSNSADVADAQTVDANDIVDELTSVRKYPQYPNNAKHESADAGGASVISHDSSGSDAEAAFNEYSSKNTGNIDPVSSESYGTIPEVSSGQRRDDISGIEPDISVPSPQSTSAKISRYFTLGQLTNASASHRIPPSIYEQVVKNHIYLAYNVLDPLKQQFPDLIITSAWRENSKNHITGLAIDIVSPSRSMEKHAEMARWARDNLPVDQVFLEKNTSGRSHVHLRATKSQGVNPKTMTCADSKCIINTDGIDVGYLIKNGTR